MFGVDGDREPETERQTGQQSRADTEDREY